ncbi:MAG: carbohydrate ABC transporter permease [Bifidobacteriaceae bacterium]|jgi:alpha-glucoside transport system permease protein|nr:carbohydrate ABC transporter permease [Bifidobacteriaceae bacterium]
MSGPTLRRVRGLVGRVANHAALVGIVLVWAVPVVALAVSSFRTAYDISLTPWWDGLAPPWEFTFENYSTVLTRGGIGRNFINSAVITVPVTAIAVVIASFAGYVFARCRFAARETIFVGILALLSVPLQMTLVPVLRLFSATDLVGTFPAIWIAHVGYALPFSIYLLRNFFVSLPAELFEAAWIDGANEPQTFLRVAVPLAAPALAAVAVFEFMFVWNDLLVALIYLGGSPDVAPLTVAVSSLVNSRGEGWEVLTAAAFILMSVPLVVFFALQRYFVRGMLARAVK